MIKTAPKPISVPATSAPPTRPPRRTSAPIAVPARFDVHEVDTVLDRILSSAEDNCVVPIDCSRVVFMDEAAIQALLNASLFCAERGSVLELTVLSTAARVTLELTETAPLLNIDDPTGAQQ